MYKIKYLKDINDNRLLPFQYYDEFDLISIPMNNKIPLIPKWNKITKTVPPTYYDNNIGLLTGYINNITVIDIDEKDNGLTFWNEIISDNKEILTPIVKTPSGYHYYFKYNNKIPTMNRLKKNDKKIGIDIRNDNALVVAPPSNDYKWIKNYSLDDLKIIKIPLWLEKIIIQHKK